MSISVSRWTLFLSLRASRITDDINPSMKQSGLYCCFSVPFFMTSLFAFDFPSCHAGIVSSFFHSFSTAAFASGIFIACGIGMNLYAKLY